jgi:thioredoxin-related protein
MVEIAKVGLLMRILFSIVLILISVTGYASDEARVEPASKHEVEKAQPNGPSIQQLESFQQVAEIARARGVPILVQFCSFWCKHCDVMEQRVLKPMMLNDKYRERILLKKLEVDSYETITDFDGRQYSSDEFSKMYNVDFYPTLVFFDANGREIGQRIVGLTLIEFAVEELDSAIEEAAQALAGVE